MKKRLALTLSLLFLLLLAGCGAKEEVSYYPTKIQTVRDTGDVTVTEYAYDDQWNLLSTVITLNSKVSSETEYVYSQDYTVLTSTTTSAIYGPTTTKILRTFDEKGQIVATESYDGDTLFSSTEYTYDEEGRKIRAISTSPESGITTTVERIFDKDGNLIRFTQEAGMYTAYQEYSYNEKSQRIREDCYHNGELTSYSAYTWEGNTAYGSHYNQEGILLAKTIQQLDDAGNYLSEEYFDTNGNFQHGTYSEYIGTNGNITSGIPEATENAQ